MSTTIKVVAVGCGVVAELCAGMAGLAAPFIASLALAVGGSLLIGKSWPKRQGDGRPDFSTNCGDEDDDGYGYSGARVDIGRMWQCVCVVIDGSSAVACG